MRLLRYPSVCVFVLALAGMGVAQSGCDVLATPISDSDVPRDDVQRGWLEFEIGSLQPMVAADGALYTFNQPSGQLLVFDAANPSTPSVRLRAGPGLVAVERRPGSSELWALDRISGVAQVIDLVTQSIVRSVQVGAEPHAIVFSPSGDRAWVSCSAVDRVDVVDLRAGSPSEYEVVQSIEIPARQPRAMKLIGNRLLVASFMSGNNSAPKTINGVAFDTRVARVTAEEGAVAELPDRDVMTIQVDPQNPLGDAYDEAPVVRKVGTTLFNLHVRPGTQEAWVPNTDALNVQFVGEKNFIDGRVVKNQISIVDLASGSITYVDLDALAPEGVSVAQPTGIAFDQIGGRAYVACYGGDVVLSLDYSGNLMGYIRIPSRGAWRSGPRACVVEGRKLYVYNKNDTSITVVDLTNAPVGEVVAPAPLGLGLDPTPAAVKRGRSHIISGEASKDGSSSCASCHIDGHLDGLVWDLSAYFDPEGTANPQFAADRKGPMVTQSLRGLRESLPYHWRGEKRKLSDFNGAFVGLLEREAGELTTEEFADLRVYVESLVYPANPRQDPLRAYRPDELSGAHIFQDESLANCGGCHRLPLGTNNETMVDVPNGPVRSTKVAQLRGLIDRVKPAKLTVGGGFGSEGVVNELGAGLIHAGVLPDLADFIDAIFDVEPCQRDLMVQFMTALDTGLAPSTARAATVHAGNVERFTDHLDLIAMADQDHNELYFRGALKIPGRAPEHFSGFYLQGQGEFILESVTWGRVAPDHLIELVRQGLAEWTFYGVPKGMGFRLGIDTDGDWLANADEVRYGTSPFLADSDSDGLPDGFEVREGSDPTTSDVLGGSPSAAVVSVTTEWVTINTSRIEVVTSDLSRIEVDWTTTDGLVSGSETAHAPNGGGYAFVHSLILQGMPPQRDVDFSITVIDPAGRAQAPYVHQVQTSLLAGPLASSIDRLSARVAGDGTVTVRSRIVGRNGVGLQAYTLHLLAVVEWNGEFTAIADDAPMLSGHGGNAQWSFILPPSLTSGTNERVLHLSIHKVDDALRPIPSPLNPYVEALDKVSHLSLPF